MVKLLWLLSSLECFVLALDTVENRGRCQGDKKALRDRQLSRC